MTHFCSKDDEKYSSLLMHNFELSMACHTKQNIQKADHTRKTDDNNIGYYNSIVHSPEIQIKDIL